MKGIYAGCRMQITHVFPKREKRFARIAKLSREATVRLRWFEHYHKTKNASLTCRYFGISRKTFYKWKRRENWDTMKEEIHPANLSGTFGLACSDGFSA